MLNEASNAIKHHLINSQLNEINIHKPLIRFLHQKYNNFEEEPEIVELDIEEDVINYLYKFKNKVKPIIDDLGKE